MPCRRISDHALGDTRTPPKPSMKFPITIALCLLTMALHALADGKMFWKEEIPPTIPYQRALILFKEGSETLVLQSRYEIPKAKDKASLGWVVPVPAVPELASMAADDAQHLFMRLSLSSRPRVTRISDTVIAVLVIGLPAALGLALLYCLLSFIGPWASPDRQKHSTKLARIALYGLLAWLLLLAILFLGARAWKGGSDGVDVITEQRVGIYDVRVVKAADTRDLIAWLNANEFKFGDEDKVSFDSYVAKGWCFVVANINPTGAQSDGEIVAEGLAAPLILRFPVKDPIYPVALTATGHHDTEILIYLASATKMTCDKRLKLKFAKAVDYPPVSNLLNVEPTGFFDNEDWSYHYLCKFKDTLSSAQMTEDITFTAAPDNEPYREHVVKW